MRNLVFVLLAAFALFCSCGDDPTYGEEKLVIQVVIEGEGKVKGAGAFDYGANCTLIAVPDSVNGYHFNGWRQLPEDVIVSQDTNYTFEVDENRIIKVVFIK